MSALFFFALTVPLFLYGVSGEYGCPPPEEIAPCTCQESVYTDLKCDKIFAVDQLLRVFRNAEGYHFNTFSLKNSSLQYIPHQIFDNVAVENLVVEDVSFLNTFDLEPKNPGLESVHLFKVRVRSGWDWSKLSLFTQLKDLYLEDIPVRRLSTSFRPSVSKSLKRLRFNRCQIKSFRDTEFAEFLDLEVFSANHDAIVNVRRTMFARPSKLQQITFEYNRLTQIPVDLFTDMPDLKLIGLANNQLAVLQEATFKPVYDQLEYLRVHDNKLKCDCRIYWLLFHKPKYLTGNCESPKAVHGKQLAMLEYKDFRC